ALQFLSSNPGNAGSCREDCVLVTPDKDASNSAGCLFSGVLALTMFVAKFVGDRFWLQPGRRRVLVPKPLRQCFGLGSDAIKCFPPIPSCRMLDLDQMHRGGSAGAARMRNSEVCLLRLLPQHKRPQSSHIVF